MNRTAFKISKSPAPIDTSVSCVHQWFEAQAKLKPHAPAAISGDRIVSYSELNCCANRLARLLLSNGINSDSRVGIWMNRSPECLAALLAVMKSGAVYVPIDLKLPARRVKYILQDSNAQYVLVDVEGQQRFGELALSNVLVINVGNIVIDDDNSSDLNLPHTLSHPVYCIYTSGSAGLPKGVLVSHNGLSNYVGWAVRQYVSTDLASFAFYSSLSFDLTVTSIFVPLVAGLCVHIYPDTSDDVPVISRVLNDNLVDAIKLTPSHMMILRNAALKSSKLKVLILGGEELKGEMAYYIYQRFGYEIALFNEYGPTETVVGCMIHRFDPKTDKTGSVPIGNPIDNTTIYLLDKHKKVVAIGETGEIHIGGMGVAIGYLNNPSATATQFIDNPFVSGTRLYASGDLGRMLPDGKIEFLGRQDYQIKVRGNRIELGEIENVMLNYPSLRECVVDIMGSYHPNYREKSPFFCLRCGIASNFPNTSFGKNGVCNHCNAYDSYKSVVKDYFRTKDELNALFNEIKSRKMPHFDCLVAFSGGKDSTYALCQVVDMGMRVLAYTLDNGFISDDAKKNINNVVQHLGIKHRYLSTPHMNAIFVDSLHRHSNVCNGCFKVIYTLGINLAHEVGVSDIVIGLSKGQLFETRLSELFRTKTFNSQTFEKNLIEARKIYHRIDDAAGRLLDTSYVRNDHIIETIRFIDFYRYYDVKREDLYHYIAKRVDWNRPADTGRSTNCLLNDVGIYVHKKQRGYHNYSLPYSWDVRVGQISKEAAMKELDDTDDINEVNVLNLLKEIGYDLKLIDAQNTDPQLIAYYVSAEEIEAASLYEFASAALPDYMVPAYFVHLDKMPLTPNGKVNRRALPKPEMRKKTNEEHIEPTSSLEIELAQMWKDVLMINKVGIKDNFFALGGHSLTALMLLYNIAERYQKIVSIQEFLSKPTITGLLQYFSATTSE